MVALKGSSIERFLAAPDFAVSFILVYGPDTGLVAERARLLVAAAAGTPSDPFIVSRLSDQDLAGDPGRLNDEAFTLPLGGAKRVVWVSPAENAFAAALERYLTAPVDTCLIIAQAGDLRPQAKLRKRAETDARAIALPCYLDDGPALNRLISDLVAENGLKITDDARSALTSRLGSDRAVSRSEIQKLCLYAADKDTISSDDVEQVTGDASAVTLDNIIDAAGEGRLDDLDKSYAAALGTGITYSQVLAALSRHFLQLHRLSLPGSGGVARLKPPVHFKRKASVSRQISFWSEPETRRALDLIARAEIDTRRKSLPPEAVAGRALLSLATRAARLASRA